MDRNSIITYFDQLKTDDLQAVGNIAEDVNAISDALHSLVERINMNRRNKMLESELAEIRHEINRLSADLRLAKATDQTKA